MARITTILVNYEGYFGIVLQVAPQVIYQGQNNAYLLRQRYQMLQLQIDKIRKLIWLLNWSYRVWWRKS